MFGAAATAARLVGRRCALPQRRLKSSLYMWGTNVSGSIPSASRKIVDIPTRVDWRSAVGEDPDSSVDLKTVVCGPTDTAIILDDGRCYVSGENKQGQLGVGHKRSVGSFTLVSENAQSIALGSSSSAIIDRDGELYTFGFGGSALSGLGQLCHGDADEQLSPKLVESLIEDGVTSQQVQVGESHTTVLTNEGEVLTSGAGSYGRLGNFDTVDQLYLEPVEVLTSAATQIAGGKSFTLGLKDGVIYGWGRNHKGQLGTGYGLAVDMYSQSEVPGPIEADDLANRKVVLIAAGHSHAACITEGGELFYWGLNVHLEPELVTALLHTRMVGVTCGEDYTIALSEDGKLYSFGSGSTGVLGQASTKLLNQATLMEALAEKPVTQVSAGWKHAACLVEE